MNNRTTIRKLLAYNMGRPLPRGSKLSVPIRETRQPLVLAFIRMGGESRPWGVAYGPPGKPRILTVPEARDRELVGQMMENFAPALLEHMGHPKYVKQASVSTLPNVWLPNASHVEMLHFLAFTYTFAKRGDPARMEVLNALGRAANWLFQESTRPGQISCIDASRALRDAFTFPAEEVRQAHTGFLLAWLDTKGSFESRLKAAGVAEQRAVSTSLDPAEEKKEIPQYVEEFNEGKRTANEAKMRRMKTLIHTALEPELRHRFEITARSIDVLTADKRDVNPGVEELLEMAQESHSEYLKIESDILAGHKGWVRSPETDRNSLKAATHFVMLQAYEDRTMNALIHHDEDLQNDLLAGGDGIRGKVVAVQDAGSGRKKRPIWTIDEDLSRPLRARIGDKMVQAGYGNRRAELRRVLLSGKGLNRFQVEIVEGKTGALEPSWKGKTVTLLSLNNPGFAFMKRKMIWDRTGPGIWLTHKQRWEDWDGASGEDDRDVDAVNA